VPLDLFAGIRVRDYDNAKSWYGRLLRSEPAFFPHATEAVWELADHRQRRGAPLDCITVICRQRGDRVRRGP
jgi:hypothetical protein